MKDAAEQHEAGGEDHENVGLIERLALLYLDGDQMVEQDVPRPNLVCCNISISIKLVIGTP